MKIDLGQHQTQDGRFIRAWIEPNAPAYRAGAVRDHGFLCIEEAASKDCIKPISLRLESMSEEAWKLNGVVGTELGRKLWDERHKYDVRPFFMVHDHLGYGRIYFEPWVVEESRPSVAFFTRPDARYSKEGAVIPEDQAKSQLQALFLHERLQSRYPLIPDTYEIADALKYGEQMSEKIMSVRAEFAALVDWEFDKRLISVMMRAAGRTPLTDPDDIERYEVLSTWAIRPDHSVLENTAEFFRWFENGGKTRLEPLTAEQLASYLHTELGYSIGDAAKVGAHDALPSEDWEWFKDQRLGRMRQPIEVLHELIQREEQQSMPNKRWLDAAITAGDFCATMPAGPSTIYAVIHEYMEPFKTVPTDPLHRKALATLTYMEDPKNWLAISQAHPVSMILDAYHLHEPVSEHWSTPNESDAAVRIVESDTERTFDYGT